MAEIHIEKKKGNIWAWLIPVLLVAGLLGWFLATRGDGNAGDTGGTGTGASIGVPATATGTTLAAA